MGRKRPLKRIVVRSPIDELENEYLVDIVLSTCRNKTKEEAYEEIEKRIKSKMFFLVRQFSGIPGFSHDDVMQESLFALRYKAIVDFRRGKGSSFSNFAIMCIRRHLSTILKASYQNKKIVLNKSLSLDQERGSGGDDENLYLSDILPQVKGSLIEKLGEKEYQSILFSKLYQDLSKLERMVFFLHSKKYSYEEISKKINQYYRKNKFKKKADVKSIDNALSRLKEKAKNIFDRYGKEKEN